ncbi:antibiotic biosynthesis monooxygenase [uncultured Vibrio sp.]|uniref:putative quinol monooxygenase n=1 Tax=uncultured Vibrio sp. TaxID=114054 RepID=UPI0025F947C8|nr:antibiotic biosynthesis monooxygenase [uncultured Vibrio sp.]
MTTLLISAGLRLTDNSDRTFAIEQLTQLVAKTNKEKGCQYFELLANKEDPRAFTLWERWDDEQALSNHFNQAHTKAYLQHDLTEVVYIEKLQTL